MKRSSIHHLLGFALTTLVALVGGTSCGGEVPYTIDNVVVARVGDEKLTRPELRSAMPSGLNETDSAAYAQEYIRAWIDEQLLYRQGQHHLKNLRQIDEQVADYRRSLVARTYEQQLLEKQVKTVSDNECWNYYEQEAAQMKLDRPILQGLYIKTLTNQGQVEELRRNIRNLQKGKADEVELIERYCLQRAAAYDNFFQRWVAVEAVVAKLPAAFEVQGGRQLQTKGALVEATDSLYTYLIFVKDFRNVGETTPYEYALPDIRTRLLHRRRLEARETVRQQLYDEAVEQQVVTLYP
jgi:hypothetical protein